MTKFQVGQKVRCVETTKQKGAGWILDRTFIINRISNLSSTPIYWESDNQCGVYETGLEIAAIESWEDELK